MDPFDDIKLKPYLVQNIVCVIRGFMKINQKREDMYCIKAEKNVSGVDYSDIKTFAGIIFGNDRVVNTQFQLHSWEWTISGMEKIKHT